MVDGEHFSVLVGGFDSRTLHSGASGVGIIA